jgi:hypothetical protein
VSKFPPAEELHDHMAAALGRFLLAFSVSQGAPDTLRLPDELSSQQSRVSVSDHLITSQAGVWFDWSLFGNDDGWEGTRGTQSRRHDLAQIFDGSYFVGDVAIVLDAAKGTVQAWFCQAHSDLAGNLRSDPLAITGTTSAGPLDENNPSCLAWHASGTDIRVQLCPM